MRWMRRLLASFGAALLLMGGFLLVLGPARLARQLAGVDVGLFALGLVAILVALGCWSEASRRLFVAADAPLSRRRAAVAYGAGAFGKQVLPMGNAGGPAVMAYAFDREVNLGYGRTLAVVVVAEFLSLVASVVLGLVGVAVLLSVGSSVTGLRWLGVAVVLVGALLAALGVVVWYRRRHVAAAVAGVARVLRPVVARVSPARAARLRPDHVEAGLGRYYATFDTVLADRRALVAAVALTQVGWVFFAVPLYTGALALGVRVPPALVLFLVPVAGLATFFPLPGGLGGVEVVLVGLLAALAAVDLTAAGAVVILYRLCSFWFFVLVGGVAASASAVGVRELAAPLDPSTAGPEESKAVASVDDPDGG